MASLSIGRVMAGSAGKGSLELIVDVTPFIQVHQPDPVRGWSVSPLFIRWNFPAIGARGPRIFGEVTGSLLFTDARSRCARRPSISGMRRDLASASRKATAARGWSATASSTFRTRGGSSPIQARTSISSTSASVFCDDRKLSVPHIHPTILSIGDLPYSVREGWLDGLSPARVDGRHDKRDPRSEKRSIDHPHLRSARPQSSLVSMEPFVLTRIDPLIDTAVTFTGQPHTIVGATAANTHVQGSILSEIGGK